MPKKNIISISLQKKMLKDILFNSTACKQMQIIIDIDDISYFKNRAIEFITQGDLVKAQMLLNIARCKNEGVKRAKQ